MVTPKIYKDAIEKGIVTTEMMCDALFSVNKRAKNYRDAERLSREYYYDKYSKSKQMKKDMMYKKKEMLLSFLSPVCIHRECLGYKRTRVYDYEQGYADMYIRQRLMGRVVWMNSFYNYGQEIEFFDYVSNEPRYNYYLYYVCGNSTFHSPIKDDKLEQYDLPIIDIGRLLTEGHGVTDLLSVQFVDKMITMLQSGDAKYVKTLEDNPPVYKQDISSFTDEFVMSSKDVSCAVSYAIPKLESVVLTLVNDIDIDCNLISVFRKNIKIKQSVRKRDGFYRHPNVSSVSLCISKLFCRSEMIGFLYRGLKDISDDDIRYCKFFELCCSKDAPIYDDLMNAVRIYQLKRKARESVVEEVEKLYEQNKYRQIVNKDGIICYN